MKNPQELIGKKVRGFKFEDERVNYVGIMNDYIGQVGEIKKLSLRRIYFQVEFKNGISFAYPSDQIEAHLVEDEIPTLSDGVMMLVSDDDKYYEPREVYFKYNGKYYAKPRLTMELTTFRYAKPLEPTKEEQLTAILGSSEKVAEIMELFNDKN